MDSYRRPYLSLLLLLIFPCLTLSSPDQRTKYVRRDLLTDVTSTVPDSLRDDITQGVLQNWWFGIPRDVAAVRDAFGISDINSLRAENEFMNVPGYANYTSHGWNLRVSGLLHTEPYFMLPLATQNAIARVFVPDVDWNSLTANEQNNARNLTGALFSVPIEGEELRFHLKWAGESPIGNNNSGTGWEDRITFPQRTNEVGEIQGFLELQGRGLPDGREEGGVAGVLDIWTEGIESGNSTGYLVPERGVTIISDIDDILRVTKIYDPKEGLLNTFARDFVPWMNMPSIFAAWSSSNTLSSNFSRRSSPRSPYHFHYLTTTPEQATRVYMDFIYTHYPLGSFDTRPFTARTASDTFNVRRNLLHQIFQTFPSRKFVLIGDTTNPDVLSEYPNLASTFPGQVNCILIRNVSATEPDNRLPYNTAAFANLKREMYMFFNTPNDLAGLDFYRGDCVNPNVRQYVGGEYGFGWRNVPSDGGLFGFDNLGGALSSWRADKDMILGMFLMVGITIFINISVCPKYFSF
ncbi:hypothetical protein BDZ91DRAFT_845742 [Kalaharituber pfeilii]|nr:hypothetical protein BDZ91DRAFT_845742 [Kalaharituber pfeilii]